MAKPKTYALSPLYKAAGTNQTTLLKIFKDLKIVPIQEMKVGKSTYRLFGQDAMDAALAWREAQNAPPAAPVLAPTESLADDVATCCNLVSDMTSETRLHWHALHEKYDHLSKAVQAQHKDAVTQWRDLDSRLGAHLQYLNDKLNQLLAQVSALNTEMGVSSQVLNVVACAPADDKPAS
jgi:hypothetical protein